MFLSKLYHTYPPVFGVGMISTIDQASTATTTNSAHSTR